MPDPTTSTKKPTPAPPCRLYAILAREAPVGVIFRRGPSKWVQIIHWNTATDAFTPGQWFHGRICGRRCDLSPNGKRLLYFAEKITGRTHDDQEYTPCWTAISKPPYLTALALWPSGWCGGSGGLFSSNEEVWLNHHESREIPHPDHLPQDLKVETGQPLGEQARLVRRLARDGWRLTQDWQIDYKRSRRGLGTRPPRIQNKENPVGGQTLTMTSNVLTTGEARDTYSIRDGDGRNLPLEGAEWADWDQKGRLVFAQDGKMSALAADAIGHEPPRELVDLNANEPEVMEAPEWAKHW